MVEFVKELQQLNNKVKVEVPQDNINEILNDPRQYALDFVEANFTKHLPRYLKAYKLGSKFAKKNMGAK